MELNEQQFYELLDEQKYLKDDILTLSQIIQKNTSNYDGVFDVIWVLYQELPEFQQIRLIKKLKEQ